MTFSIFAYSVSFGEVILSIYANSMHNASTPAYYKMSNAPTLEMSIKRFRFIYSGFYFWDILISG